MSRRQQITMTDAEVENFLGEARDLHVATIGPDGAPHMVTMWYGFVDGRIAFWTYGKSQKIVNLRRDPRITVLVADGDTYDALRGVQIRGRAALVDDADEVFEIGLAVYERNAARFGDTSVPAGGGEGGSEGGGAGPSLDEATREGVRAMSAKRIGVVIEPETVVSWNHRKLGGTY